MNRGGVKVPPETAASMQRFAQSVARVHACDSMRPVGTKLLPASLCALLVAAQPGPAHPAGDESARPMTESVDVRLVMLPTTVVDRRGRPVRGLTAADFELRELGESQTIELFDTEENAPIALAFLLDTSGSMALGGHLEQAKAAIRQIADTLGHRDRVGLIRFADERVEWVSTFDDPRAAFYQRLAALEAGGETALYDAMTAAATLVDSERPGRKAILLVTDGADNASSIPQLEATWMARRVSLPIYTLGFVPVPKKLLPLRLRESLRVLGRFSGETGGTLIPLHEPRDLERAARALAKELKFQYVIGFYSRGTPRDGSFRGVSLTTLKDGLSVRTRRGYYDDP